jgi:hypothetical protein
VAAQYDGFVERPCTPPHLCGRKQVKRWPKF